MKFRPTPDLEGVSIEHFPSPHAYHRMITLADVHVITGPFGSILQQEEHGKQYHLTKECFLLTGPATVEMETDVPLIVMAYTQTGRMVVEHDLLGKMEHMKKTAFIYYLPPGRHKTSLPAGDCTVLKLYITLELLELICPDHPDMGKLLQCVRGEHPGGYVLPLVDTKLLTRGLLNTITSCKEIAGQRKLFIDQSIETLLKIYVESRTKRTPKERRSYKVSAEHLATLKQAEAKLGKEAAMFLKMKDAAIELGIPLRHFAEAVKIVHDCGWRTYQKKLKIAEACELLLTTDKTVAEIAYTLGYNDPPQFGRSFKEEIGCSPEQYRRDKRDD